VCVCTGIRGIHSKKLYHIGRRIPFWVRTLLPTLNFDLEEEVLSFLFPVCLLVFVFVCMCLHARVYVEMCALFLSLYWLRM
jgi:hypothetical protein